MSTPTPPPLAAPGAAPPDPYTAELEPGLTTAEKALLTALAVYFASSAAVAAVVLPVALAAQLATVLGVPRLAALTAARLTLSVPLTGRRRGGSPSKTLLDGRPSMALMVAAQEPAMRARYLLAATKRLGRARARGRFTTGIRRERDYLAAHRKAGKRRAAIARDYDRAAQGSEYLRWTTAGDDRVTPDCRAREGTVWHVSHPPYPPPGAQHPWCRCRAAPL